MPYRIGIVGTRWGRTHVGTFRAAGCTIHAIVGADPARSAEVAAAEGVPYSEPAALADCDIVVIATPIATHRALVERHADRLLYCEKPLFGSPPDAHDRALVERTRLGVAYAFAFLDTAQRLQDAAAGHPLSVRLQVDVRLGAPASALESLRQCAIHPLSWLHHAFGPVALDELRLEDDRVVAALTLAGRPLELDVGVGDAEGIAIAIALTCERGVVETRGGYRPGAGWSFAPVTVDGLARGPAEDAAGEDVWYRANRRAVAAFVAWFDGHLDDATARARGLFDGARALAFEDGLGALLGSRTGAP